MKLTFLDAQSDQGNDPRKMNVLARIIHWKL